MQPLFTIHAGEFLVADHIERSFRSTKVWIPTKDTGIDLLVTDSSCRRSVSLQVKYSRDYLVTHLPSSYQGGLRACGWWTINADKLSKSPADYWVLLLVGFDNRTRDYVVIRPTELTARLAAIKSASRSQLYLWTTKGGKCWATHGLKVADQQSIVSGRYTNPERDFTDCLDAWRPIAELSAADSACAKQACCEVAPDA